MRRIAELDGLRGAAAVMIVCYHMFMNRLPWGWAAVDVFFVLSGYLITAIVLEHGKSWRFLLPFYARRGLRTWPIYYLAIVILALCWLDDPAALTYYLTYTQQAPRYWGGETPGWVAMQHTWTLALEEQFYLIWPALVLMAGRRWTGPLAMALAIVSIAARGAGVHPWVLAGRCDGFALGGLLAAIMAAPDPDRARSRVRNGAIGCGGLALVLLIGLGASGRLIEAGGPTTFTFALHVTVASLASFAGVALVIVNVGHPVLAPLRMRPLVYLGTISYGLYLYHHPILMSSPALRRSLGVGFGPVLWATEWLLTLVAAVVSWHLLERSILGLKDRFPYQRAADPSRADLPSLELGKSVSATAV